jgi:hypothetical protein
VLLGKPFIGSLILAIGIIDANVPTTITQLS